MSEVPSNVTLSPSEWRLVEAIRALPESGLRERTLEVMGELLFYVQNPRCQGIGAEGFPCGEPVSTCEECHAVWDFLDQLASRVSKV